MLSYDERCVFDRYMQSGYQCEIKGNLEFAIARYSSAYSVAKDAKDNGAMQEAKRSLDRCDEKLKKGNAGMSR